MYICVCACVFNICTYVLSVVATVYSSMITFFEVVKTIIENTKLLSCMYIVIYVYLCRNLQYN